MKTQALCCLLLMGSVMLLTAPTFAEDPTPTPVPTTAEAAQPADAKKEEPLKLNVNFATIEELKTLPGVDETIAAAIFKGHPYQQIDDLLNVPGVTKELLAGFQEMVTVKKLNVNAATVAQLHMLPGIDEAMAQAIITNRPEGDGYKIVEELLAVKGFSEDKLKALAELIEAGPVSENEKRGWAVKQPSQQSDVNRGIEVEE